MTMTPDHLWTVLPWAVIAVATCGALYFILGRNIGAQSLKTGEQSKLKAGQPKLISVNAVKPPPLPKNQVVPLVGLTETILPTEGTQAAVVLQRLQAEQRFSTEGFFNGVEGTFKAILPAYASGDTAVLSKWTDSHVLEVFSKNIEERTKEHLTVHCEVEQVEKIKIEDAQEVNGRWRVTTDIFSWQMNYTTDAKEEVVLGNASRTFFQDRWVFEADVVSKEENLTWKLVETQVL